MADLLSQIGIRLLSVLLSSGIIVMLLLHIARFLEFPKKSNTLTNAVFVSGIVGAFVFITGTILLLIPSLGESVVMGTLLSIANLVILTCMVKLFYQTSWKNSLYSLGLILISMIVLGVIVGIILGVVQNLV